MYIELARQVSQHLGAACGKTVRRAGRGETSSRGGCSGVQRSRRVGDQVGVNIMIDCK
jgi:hypothetical protein